MREHQASGQKTSPRHLMFEWKREVRIAKEMSHLTQSDNSAIILETGRHNLTTCLFELYGGF